MVFPMKQAIALGLLCMSASVYAMPTSPRSVVDSLLPKLLNQSKYGRFGPNDGGQFKQLSRRLQQLAMALECDGQAAAAAEPGPYLFPTSRQLFDRWDTPTACGTTRHRTLGLTSDVEVACTWGPQTDHQSGHLQLHFLLIREDGHWRVHDVTHGAQEDARSASEITTTTFSERLKRNAHQSPEPGVCQKRYPDPQDPRPDEPPAADVDGETTAAPAPVK
jgi:hypothetical protein